MFSAVLRAGVSTPRERKVRPSEVWRRMRSSSAPGPVVSTSSSLPVWTISVELPTTRCSWASGRVSRMRCACEALRRDRPLESMG